jgi:DNA-binding NarL/FixJ family response regulator
VQSLRILLADDSPAVLERVTEMLEDEFIVSGAFGNGKSVLQNVTELSPDVIVLDISLGDMTGFEVAERLRVMRCGAKIVFLTVHESIDFVHAAIAVGAAGYVFKSQAASELRNAILSASRGLKSFPAGCQ